MDWYFTIKTRAIAVEVDDEPDHQIYLETMW